MALALPALRKRKCSPKRSVGNLMTSFRNAELSNQPNTNNRGCRTDQRPQETNFPSGLKHRGYVTYPSAD